jgi:hypothetical protein
MTRGLSGTLDVAGPAPAAVSAVFLRRASEETPQCIRSWAGPDVALQRRRCGFSVRGVGLALQRVRRSL